MAKKIPSTTPTASPSNVLSSPTVTTEPTSQPAATPTHTPITAKEPTKTPTNEGQDSENKDIGTNELNTTKPKKQNHWLDLHTALLQDKPDDAIAKLTPPLKAIIENTLTLHTNVRDNYNILILFDEAPLQRSEADLIYKAVASFDQKKPILLVLYSPGGSIEAGYFISKLCREYADKKFLVAIPRQAKSAATLVCCGADEIHMGSLSELGPIDPQIDGLPALGLKQSIQHLAELTVQYPQSTSLFSSYLKESLKLIHLGYYERVAESAVQYAEALLLKRLTGKCPKAREIAKKLVYEYKDHGFVIDQLEASEIFTESITKFNTPEYLFSNQIYENMKLVHTLASINNYMFYFIGSIDSKPHLIAKTLKP